MKTFLSIVFYFFYLLSFCTYFPMSLYLAYTCACHNVNREFAIVLVLNSLIFFSMSVITTIMKELKK